jgi:protein arginine N-methyltransferase 5
MLTSPITTPQFQSSVIKLVRDHLAHLETHPGTPPPIIPPLRAVDTPLAPGDIVSQLVCCVSPWIDLASPNPLISSISRQVLALEVAYASFCGVGNIIVPGPRAHGARSRDASGLVQYARAIEEALGVSGYIHMAIEIPMIDFGDEVDIIGEDLAGLVPEVYDAEEERQWAENGADEFATWDSWNTIRTMCDYNSRLSVGKSLYANVSCHMCQNFTAKRTPNKHSQLFKSRIHYPTSPCNLDGILSPYDSLR